MQRIPENDAGTREKKTLIVHHSFVSLKAHSQSVHAARQNSGILARFREHTSIDCAIIVDDTTPDIV